MQGHESRLSVIIPNHNGSATIARCLDTLIAAAVDEEVIVVDDRSDDDSVRLVKTFPCALIRLDRRLGAAGARNAGARASTGDFLLFIDADCIVLEETLPLVRTAIDRLGDSRAAIGGTYTPLPADQGFFSVFQSVFVSHFETKRLEPDYLAGHLLVVPRHIFAEVGGFPEDPILPIIEDVAFSHRLVRAGCRLIMDPALRVRHIFNYTFGKSMRNAFWKARYWTMYSLRNGDLWRDSGTASAELKVGAACWLAGGLSLTLAIALGRPALLAPLPFLLGLGLSANRGLVAAFHRAGGPGFAFLATGYYLFIYPLAVWAGVLAGAAGFVGAGLRGVR